MSLEQQILDWSTGRPAWQRMVLRKIAVGEVFSAEDYDRLTKNLIDSKETGDSDFRLEHFPETKPGDSSVSLVSIAQPHHVNALESDNPLTFEATGLTIIYGDNASGKSGYARLLKLIARARHQEDILSDVFRDTVLVKPKAALNVRIGGVEKSVLWPEESMPELRRMLFYDQACGSSYITTESDFPFRPSALFIMNGLIEACVAIKNRIDLKLESNEQSSQTLPAVDENLKLTEVGRYLRGLSGSSSLQHLDQLLSKADQGNETISRLQSEESRLRNADTTTEKLKLTRKAAKIDSIETHLTKLETTLSKEAIGDLFDERDRLRALAESADLLAKEFATEPLVGVGASSWKELWESARRFSEESAYPDQEFPVVTEDANCLLCQQPLLAQARARLSRFEKFVQDDTQKRLQVARAKWDARFAALVGLATTPEAISTHLQDLETDYPEIVGDVRTLIASCEATRLSVVSSIRDNKEFAGAGIGLGQINSRLHTAALTARGAAERLSNPKGVEDRLRAIVIEVRELQFLQRVKEQRDVIAAEIKRLKEREKLEAIKSAAATGTITKKILELSEESITEVVRDTFTRETDRLHLERVTIAMTRGERGMLLHQPKLVGARQAVALPRIFSEGERTALGLAAFFTEAHLDASKSALILDDPVTSLDHIRRGLVAARLAALAETQVATSFS